MRKEEQKRKPMAKVLAALLCVSLTLQSLPLNAFAAEQESENETVVETQEVEESGEEKEGAQDGQTSSADEGEPEGNTEKNTEKDSDSSMESETESETPKTPESEIEEQTQEESVSEKTETEEILLDSDWNIASGEINESYGHINWVVDADKKLIVTGTGDYSDSSNYDRAPWYRLSTEILSAEINVTGMTNASCMFSDCKRLTSLDISNFDTRNVTNMRWMFSGCSNLPSLDLRDFDTRNVTDMCQCH